MSNSTHLRIVFAAAIAFLGFQSANAQEGRCGDMQWPSDIVRCMDKEQKSTEQELDRTYRQVLTRIDDRVKQDQVSKIELTKIRAQIARSQRDWKRLRDRDCAVESALSGGGSGHAAAGLDCLKVRAQHRIVELRRIE